MQKDVIYIDVEDDITAIIGKVKNSTAHIVALVPPKRLGAIQSAVNLKLVHRAAEQVDKRLVIISNNPALVALAASAAIPVAKNLQSKPELAEVSALEIDEGEDVIDGADLPDVTSVAATPEVARAAEKAGAVTALGATAVAAKGKRKIPNFGSFRKKLFIGIAAAILLIGVLVWALVFAPRATIIVTARTSNSALTTKVTMADTLTTSLTNGTIKSVTKTSKSDVSIPFTATGSKNVGDKATGTVKLSQQSQTATTVAAGTSLTASGGSVFTTDSAVTVPASTVGGGGCFPTACPGTATVTVTAAQPGTSYNGASGAVSGSGMSASFVGSSAGGTDKTAIIVQQSDVDQVSTSIVSDTDVNAAKAALAKQFGSDYVVLSDSFKQDTSAVKPNPAVGAESTDGKGVLAGSVTFTLVAIPKSELNTFLSAYFAQQIDGKNDQKVYDNGIGSVSFTGVSAAATGYTANITANGKIGPNIDEEALKVYAKGKNFGDIQSHVQAISGVDSVDVKFSPFWVQSAPNDTKKIQVEFKVNG